MTATEQFIKDAIKGGWQPEKHRQVTVFNPNNRAGVTHGLRASYTEVEILLDPLAWKARERWLATKNGRAVSDTTIKLAARHDFNEFMNGIWEGLSIEDSLAKL